MPRIRKRKTNRGQTDIVVYETALAEVEGGFLSVRGAAKKYNLCHMTLNRFKNKKDQSKSDGSVVSIGYRAWNKVFSDEQEKTLAYHIIESADNYNKFDSEEVRRFAYELAKKENTNIPPQWEKNKSAPRDWFSSFIRRQEKLAVLCQQDDCVSQINTRGKTNIEVCDNVIEDIKSEIDLKDLSCVDEETVLDSSTMNSKRTMFNTFQQASADSRSSFSREIEDNALEQELLELLTSWGVKNLHSICLEQGIDMKILKIMTPRHCELLAKGFKLATLIQFEHKLKEWQTQQNAAISSSFSIFNETANETQRDSIELDENLTLNENPTTNSDNSDKVDIRAILMSTNQGKRIIDVFNTTNSLNDGCRNIIVDLITKYLLQNEIKMKVSLAREISEQVVKIFPTEIKDIYFLKERGRAPMGKVYAKYFNQLRALKNSGLWKDTEKATTSNVTTSSPNTIFSRVEIPMNIKTEIEIDGQLEVIRSGECSWDELEELWRTTTGHRAKYFKNGASVESILNEFPQYKKPRGYKLFEIDFSAAFPTAGNFVEQFPKMYDKLIHLFSKKIKDPSSLNLLKEIQESSYISENGQYVSALHLLHAVLVPTGKEISIKNDKKCYHKFSIKDSQNAFITFVNTEEEMEDVLKKAKEKKEIHPQLIIIGEVSRPAKIFLHFEGISYTFYSVLKAVDVCFKVYHVFRLKYPFASVLVWLLLQKLFYKINTEFERSSPNLTFLITELENSNNKVT